MRKPVSSILLASCLGAAWALPPQLQLDSLHAALDTMSNNMESTLLGKDDLPLAVSGYMAFRLKNFQYSEPSPWVRDDRARTAVDATLNVNVVAMPNSYITLFTNLSFPFDLTGTYSNNLAKNPTNAPSKDERVLYDHSTDYYSSTLNEEFNVGVDIRAGVFGAYVTAGGVIWANASPLTMWERETMARFSWQYELYEDEKTVSTYYKEKSFKPVKEGGRAFWTNRSFGGIFANVYQLPANMKAQFLVSQPMDADMATRDGLRMYGGQPAELEMIGSYDLRGSVYHGRIAKEKIADNLTIGLNYLGVVYDDGTIYEPAFSRQWIAAAYRYDSIKGASPVLLNNHVASLDIKGNVTPKLYLMGEFAGNMVDSVIFYQSKQTKGYNDQDAYSGFSAAGHNATFDSPGSFEFGAYVKAQSKHIEGWPLTVEAAYFSKNFYSPYAITNPSRFPGWRKDEAYLNGGSLRYSPNMAGVNLKLEPTFNRGYFDLQYGQHRQIEKGRDVIVFNYRLNGRAMWESSNSWTKHKPLFVADSGNYSGAGYYNRAGVEMGTEEGVKQYRQRGGLYGGTWELWESFVAYEDASQIQEGEVPMHAKWDSYFSFMGGYDIGHWFGTDRNIMMTALVALSGVSNSFAPLAVSENMSDMLLWSFYGQFEPTVAITTKFHMVGILGLETFRSNYAYQAQSISSTVSQTSDYKSQVNTFFYKKSPINYREFAVGAGFDWDFADRVGLHVRYKYMTHSDETLSVNDWHSHYISAETKAWF